MKQKTLEGWEAVATTTVLPRVAALRRFARELRRGGDAECLHQTRVACRRVRSALGAFEDYLGKRARKWRKRIRGVTRVLGCARDLDVQMEFVRGWIEDQEDPAIRAGPRRLLSYLASRRRKAQVALEGALEEIERTGVLDRIEEVADRTLERVGRKRAREFRPLAHRLAREAVLGEVRAVLRYEEFVSRPECVEELHQMRIAAKRLRYTLEIFASWHEKDLGSALAVSKRLQGLLGEIHDCDVWIEFLPRFLHMERRRAAGRDGPHLARIAAGVGRVREDRRRERERLHGKLRRLWRRWKKAGKWSKIAKSVRDAS